MLKSEATSVPPQGNSRSHIRLDGRRRARSSGAGPSGHPERPAVGFHHLAQPLKQTGCPQKTLQSLPPAPSSEPDVEERASSLHAAPPHPDPYPTSPPETFNRRPLVVTPEGRRHPRQADQGRRASFRLRPRWLFVPCIRPSLAPLGLLKHTGAPKIASAGTTPLARFPSVGYG